jgi:thioredoxin-like negative regulator of GroEL
MKRVGGRLPLRQAAAAAHASIDRALALAPDGTYTLWQLGEIQLNLDLDYASAESTFNQVLERSPKVIWMHYNLATIAVREGRAREALRLLSTAAALDAGYEQGGFLNSYAWLLQILGQNEQALRIAAQGLDLAWGGQERAINLRCQAFALFALGRVEEARPMIVESWELSGHLTPEAHAFLFAKVGELERARAILDDVRDDASDRHALALGELALGNLDAAFAAIEAGIRDHDPQLADSLRNAPWWDPLRRDARYRAMVETLEAEEKHTERFSRSGARRPGATPGRSVL